MLLHLLLNLTYTGSAMPLEALEVSLSGQTMPAGLHVLPCCSKPVAARRLAHSVKHCCQLLHTECFVLQASLSTMLQGGRGLAAVVTVLMPVHLRRRPGAWWQLIEALLHLAAPHQVSPVHFAG